MHCQHSIFIITITFFWIFISFLTKTFYKIEVILIIDTCISDPDLCADQNRFSYSGMKGLSVSFWLKITEDNVRVNGGDKNQQHQYIISSGGQVPDSRGFSFLYAAEQNKFKLQLQTKKYIYTVEMDDLEQTWIHFAFTWKVDGKLILVSMPCLHK